MKVCVAEKPSVALEIAKVLGARTKKDGYYEGNGYQVTWTFGHLCQLKQPDAYDPKWKRWGMELLPMIPPEYEVELIANPGIKKQFKVIKDLYKHATEIINCGDAGQEGELIQRWVMELAGVKCPVKRLWISSLTEEAIRDGFLHLQPQSRYDSLYQAGLARAEGDWLLGMNATRLYTLKYGGYKQVLSVGRVQTPTLAMIVARDNEIENFKPEPYWLLTTQYRDTIFTCTHERYNDQSIAKKMLDLAWQDKLTVKDVQQKRCCEQSPQLYDLTSLQVDCNRKFGFSADTTLKNIQSLYEKKLCTYPRVDTKYLTDDIYTKCPDIIGGLSSYSQAATALLGRLLPKSKRIFDNAKVTDHHAIIPTGDMRSFSSINDYERKVYDLIVLRFLAAFYPPCEYAQTTVIAVTGNTPSLRGKVLPVGTPLPSCGGAGVGSLSSILEFKATGRTVLSEGWRAVYGKAIEDDEKDVENMPLPVFKVGESGLHNPKLEQKLTTPPKRYTEASLLQSMETAGKLVDDETLRDALKENGIGRPSSRAGIIETLIKRGYIRRERKNLVSTPTGRTLIEVIQDKTLKSPELTGQWEKKLRDIEHGHYTLNQFMQELQGQLVTIIHGVQSGTANR